MKMSGFTHTDTVSVDATEFKSVSSYGAENLFMV